MKSYQGKKLYQTTHQLVPLWMLYKQAFLYYTFWAFLARNPFYVFFLSYTTTLNYSEYSYILAGTLCH